MIEVEMPPAKSVEEKTVEQWVYWNHFFGRRVEKNLLTGDYRWEGGQVVVTA
jgi:hypothetical protein